MKSAKSKTMWFAMALAATGIVEANLHLLQSTLPVESYAYITIVIGIIVAVLRVLTTTSLEDK